MRRTRPFTIAVAGAIVALAAFTGCSGGAGNSSAPDQAGGGAVNGSAPEAAAKPGAQQRDGGGGSAADQGKTAPRIQIRERAIIRTGTLHVEVKNVQAAADRMTALASGDGYVSSEQSTTDEDGKVTSVQVVLRVPVADFDRVRTEIRKLGGKVLADKHNAQDVTDEVVDVESRIESQQKSIDRLRALIGQAKTVGEVVQVETELTSREAELESLQARQATLASQSTLSTLNVTLSAPPPDDTVPPDDDNLGFLSGLAGGWDAFVGTVQVVLTVIGALIPFVVALALIAAAPVWFYLRARRRRVSAQTSL